MPIIEIIVFLMVVLAALSAFVNRLRIPQPVLLVIAGLVIGFTPQLPDVALKPETVFLIFLPPLLFATAWKLSWHDFKAERRPIISLSTGLVFFSTVAIAFVAHYFIPGFSWQMGFVLGAVISPPDAVAATSVTKGLGLHKRVITILEGESLLNDASALVAYRYAIASVVTGGFIFWKAGVQFVWVASGGVLVGLAIGWILTWAHRRIHDNPTLEVTFTILAPYVAYLLAEHFHLSGVLAVVAAGLYLSFRSPESFAFQTRLQVNSFWEIIEFLLNGFVFILIGMQLPVIVADIEKSSLLYAVGYGLLITAVAIVVRVVWVFPAAYLAGLLSRNTRERSINWRYVAIISWTGMRGVVSLASALAIPLTLANGREFPQRDMILFIMFCVIFCTLVFQGLSLPFLIKLLKIQKDDGSESAEETRIRKEMTVKALAYIKDNIPDDGLDENVVKRLTNKYESRLRLARAKSPKNDKASRATASFVFGQYIQAQKDVVDYERSLLIQMHKEDATGSEILKKIEYELDLEESRLKEQMKRVK